jgi:hypothetical protein
MRIGAVAMLASQGIAVGVTFLYAYGLLLAAVWFVPKYLWSGEWPVWPWWGYAVAPLALGAAAAAIEALCLLLTKKLGERWGTITIIVLLVTCLAAAIVINHS